MVREKLPTLGQTSTECSGPAGVCPFLMSCPLSRQGPGAAGAVPSVRPMATSTIIVLDGEGRVQLYRHHCGCSNASEPSRPKRRPARGKCKMSARETASPSTPLSRGAHAHRRRERRVLGGSRRTPAYLCPPPWGLPGTMMETGQKATCNGLDGALCPSLLSPV